MYFDFVIAKYLSKCVQTIFMFLLSLRNFCFVSRYLNKVIKQYKEEIAIALGTTARYKEALRQRQAAVLSGNSGWHATGSEGSSRKCNNNTLQKDLLLCFKCLL